MFSIPTTTRAILGLFGKRTMYSYYTDKLWAFVYFSVMNSFNTECTFVSVAH